jgi:DNA-binding SARP family transcriptional activator
VTEDLSFALLGPVRGWFDGAELELGSPYQRAVLAVLLLREGRPAAAEEIIEALWGAEPPRSVHGILRTYIYRLRRLFSGALGGDPLIQSVGGSYLLPTASAPVDARVFQERVAEARLTRGQGDPARAAALLREGLELWQGTPLSGVRGLYADRQRQRLEQLRDEAREDLFAADVERGAHQEAIPGLTQAVADNPLRERLRALLMLALYRAGRQAEALDVYSDAYRVLDQELGIAPGAALRELHGQILRADPALEPPAGRDSPAPPAAPLPPPAQLPPDIPDFTGRAAEIAEITRILSAPGDRAPLAGLTGLGGTGKSALATRAARLISSQFLGGQLYADLGASRDAPADPAEVLAGFLRASGVRTPDIPPGLDERAVLWRTIQTGRNMLVMLDDAADDDQVRHLLPTAEGSAGIVTSWRRITSLPGVQWIKVHAMTPEDSVQLLAEIAGADRIAAEPGPAGHLVASCSHLPLAVRVAAASLLDRPARSVAQVAAQLADDLRGPVLTHPAFAIVYRPLDRAQAWLDDAAATAFRLLAVPDNRSLTAASAAAALGLPENVTLSVLERLVDVDLLIPGPDGSYHYLDLVKAYARRQALSVEGPAPGRAVVRRLADYYVASARAAIHATGTPQPDLAAKHDLLAVLEQAEGLLDGPAASR